MVIKNMEDKDIIKRLELQDASVLEYVNKKYRKHFINWAIKQFMKYDLARKDLEDIFHEILLILYKNIGEGKVEKLSSSLKTYVFAIGKNLIRDELRKQGRWTYHTPEIPDESLTEDKWTYEKELMRKLVDQMDDPCKTLLKKIIYEEKNSKGLMEAMQFDSTQKIYQLKWRCLKKLKSAMFKILNEQKL